MSYNEIISALTMMAYKQEIATDANTLRGAANMIQDLHNELCHRCGRYKNEYMGACDGCKWRG